MPDSSTGGLLVPISTPPVTDDGLDDLLHDLVTGLTGLDGTMVVPRWQPADKELDEPSADTNWCAIGIINQRPDSQPSIIHSSTGDGSSTLYRNFECEIMATFYGPNGQLYATQLADGLYLPSSAEWFRSNNMGLAGVGQLRAVPELINQSYRRRFDLPIYFRRQTSRTYGIKNLLTTGIELITDVPPTDTIIPVEES